VTLWSSVRLVNRRGQVQSSLIPKTIKMVPDASLLSTHNYMDISGFSCLSNVVKQFWSRVIVISLDSFFAIDVKENRMTQAERLFSFLPFSYLYAVGLPLLWSMIWRNLAQKQNKNIFHQFALITSGSRGRTRRAPP